MTANAGSGKALRKRVPRSSFAAWTSAPDRRDPLEILRENETGRISDLVALRHERMRADVFSFYRGCAAVMAADLQNIPVTGLHVQLGGDAHLFNFGGYATPERNLVFDVNDFDETLPGPWEWDIARLCASAPLAARVRAFGKKTGEEAAYAAAESYRRRMRAFARRSPLEIWYSRVDVRGALARELTPPRDATNVKPTAEHLTLAHSMLRQYRDSLLPSLRVLLERYRVVDLFEHPVGIGSLGMLTLTAAFEARPGERLYLQIKEAKSSVLEPYLGVSVFKNHGARVVNGQRLMQAATDPFVGWTSADGRDFYVRQLRDHKASLDLAGIDAGGLVDFSRRCGAVLARAHARTGDPQAIAEYLGSGRTFEQAMVCFARLYAEQVEEDYERFCGSCPTPGPVAQR